MHTRAFWASGIKDMLRLRNNKALLEVKTLDPRPDRRCARNDEAERPVYITFNSLKSTDAPVRFLPPNGDAAGALLRLSQIVQSVFQQFGE